MDLHGSDRDGRRQIGAPSFQSDHTKQAAATPSEAVQSGASSPDSRPGRGEPDAGKSSPSPCSCGFCDGVTVEVDKVDLHSGAVEVESFERMSRRPKCPNCGGRNVQYRNSYTAHAADLARRLGARRCDAYAVTVTLDAEAVERAGLDGETTYKVWTGDGAPWSRARRALKRRDGGAVYLGTLSARPSDGVYHLHIVLVTTLRTADVREAFHVAGLDAYVQSPRPNESAEGFAARKAAYAFDNAAHGPSARFVSSRGKGAGYDSETAVQRRRNAVQSDSPGGESGESPDQSAPGGPTPPRGVLEETNDANGDDQEAKTRETAPKTSPVEAESTGETDERAPPVQLGGDTYGDRDAYMGAVRRRFTGRVGTRVQVVGLGPAKLLKVHRRDGDVRCVLHPAVGTEAVEVSWTEVTVESAPLLRQPRGFDATHNSPSRSMNEQTGAPESTAESDPVERFNEAANTSRVTVELDDGRRRVTEKNHDTGETRQYTKPPRNEAEAIHR